MNKLLGKPNRYINEDRIVDARTSKNVKLLATRQKVRLFILFVLAITFPIIVDYFSVIIPITATKEGVLAFSSIFWLLWFVTAFYFGRASCAYVCPLGALQETKDRIWPKQLPKVKNLKIVKYILSVGWMAAITTMAFIGAGITRVDLLYRNNGFVSVHNIQGVIGYSIVVLVVMLPVFLMGKRGFCHYFCPWGVLNMVASRIKNWLRYPSLHLAVDRNKCSRCVACDQSCPMSLKVFKMVQSGFINDKECNLCGCCIDVCPEGAIRYSWGRPGKTEVEHGF
jgi:ferredoxin-type protein NapH